MKAKLRQKFAAKKVLKYYEEKQKIEITKATEEARKEFKDLIKECWLKQLKIIELVIKLRACKTNLDMVMDDSVFLCYFEFNLLLRVLLHTEGCMRLDEQIARVKQYLA